MSNKILLRSPIPSLLPSFWSQLQQLSHVLVGIIFSLLCTKFHNGNQYKVLGSVRWESFLNRCKSCELLLSILYGQLMSDHVMEDAISARWNNAMRCASRSISHPHRLNGSVDRPPGCSVLIANPSQNSILQSGTRARRRHSPRPARSGPMISARRASRTISVRCCVTARSSVWLLTRR